MARRRKPRDLEDWLEALGDDLDALKKDLRGLLSDAGEVSREKAQDAVRGALSSVESVAERIEEWGEGHLEEVRDTVRKQPLTAVAVALGTGALIGALFARRR
jgi:ElaB/YqjD/DUF883 family membrane-anchored ribosome-binding protein